jgi:hypothetical protein
MIAEKAVRKPKENFTELSLAIVCYRVCIAPSKNDKKPLNRSGDQDYHWAAEIHNPEGRVTWLRRDGRESTARRYRICTGVSIKVIGFSM